PSLGLPSDLVLGLAEGVGVPRPVSERPHRLLVAAVELNEVHVVRTEPRHLGGLCGSVTADVDARLVLRRVIRDMTRFAWRVQRELPDLVFRAATHPVPANRAAGPLYPLGVLVCLEHTDHVA